MIEARTCLVLGAGASAPYGLPPAAALRDLILVGQVPHSEAVALAYPPSTTAFASLPVSNPPEVKAANAKNHWLNFLNEKCAAAGFSGPAIQEFPTAFFNAKPPENVALFDAGILKGKRVFATSKGLSPNRELEVKRMLRPIRLFDRTALELLLSVNVFSKTASEKDLSSPITIGPPTSEWLREVRSAGWQI